jgi:hypothetical protein
VTTVETERGGQIVKVSLWGTAVFAVAAVAGVLAPDTLGVVTAVVAGAMFVVGCATFLSAYRRAVSRSRTEAIGVSELYFLTGETAPREVRTRLLSALGLQVVIALAAAAARPYTVLAFAALAPVFAIGLAGLWAARYGRFPPRDAAGPR